MKLVLLSVQFVLGLIIGSKRVKRVAQTDIVEVDMVRRAELSKYALESVDRMAAVLQALETASEQPLEQVARATGLNDSTALRYLLSLSRHGFVERDEDTGLFRLGLGLFRLGTLAMDSRDILSLADPVMAALQKQFGESVNLAVYQQDKVVLIRVLGRPDSMRKEGKAGEIDPWHATSLGKAILAALPPDEARDILMGVTLQGYTPNTKTDLADLTRELNSTRQQGYSVDDEEVVEGLRCVGAAVLGHKGQVQYALSLSGPKSRMTYSRIQEIGNVLIESAAALSSRLGATGARVSL
jgi:IclR family acetate operon transcriptional repressor